MSSELEAVVWCPVCEADKYTVYRDSTEREGVYVHRIDPEGAQPKVCECGAVLERKP